MLNPAQDQRDQPHDDHREPEHLGAHVGVAQPVVLREVPEDLVDGETERDQRRTGAGPGHQRALECQPVSLGGEPRVGVHRSSMRRAVRIKSGRGCRRFQKDS